MTLFFNRNWWYEKFVALTLKPLMEKKMGILGWNSEKYFFLTVGKKGHTDIFVVEYFNTDVSI